MMSRRTHHDSDGLAYHDLTCDGCGLFYTSTTDACYDWRLLLDEAADVHWTGGPAPEGPHECPSCARRARRAGGLARLGHGT
jgi:hypothetical protein